MKKEETLKKATIKTYRHIHFVLEEITDRQGFLRRAGDVDLDAVPLKNRIYTMKNNRTGDCLGSVAWYGPWRRFVASFEDGATFDETCLADVIDFLNTITTPGR